MTDENDPLSVCCRHLANSQHIIEAKNAEIARLRLTDEEREAVEWAESHFLSDYEQLREPCDKERADTLRGLLDRLGGGK